MRKKLLIIVLLVLTAPVLALFHSSNVSATFDQNNIIDDNVFSNSGSMTAAQIDDFLNNFPSSCISSKNSFSSPEPIGYTPSGGYVYGSNVSAGTVIYDVSKVYSINPQVFLATLQKEQSLVSGSAGCHPNTPDPNSTFQCNLWGTGNIPCTSACPYSGGCIPIALGNNCPSNCQASTEGFSKQLVTAAWKLKYWQQRSEGNVNWNVQVKDFPHPGNVWDNSDDVTAGSDSYCYSGLRMTQGFFQLCPGGSYATYDGLSNVGQYSGGPIVTVHLDNGATAALYNWTPFLSGNTNFVNIFEGWFGSTHYPEPVGGLVYLQSSTGKIFLITTDNNTRYWITSWSLLQNYKLDRYQIISADDATINSYSDGGQLTNLVWDDGGVYLVNNAIKYHFPGQTVCTDWGYDCSDSTIVKQLGTTFQGAYLSAGTNLGDLAQYGSVFYKMESGNRRTVANSQTLSALGYVPQAALSMTSYNNGVRPLGNLLISNSTTLNFGTHVYYFEGGLSTPRYHAVSSAMLTAWKIKTIFTPPTSAYNSTPPAADPTPLNQWYTDGTNKYLIDGGRKINLTTAQQLLWPAASYQTYWSVLAASLPTINLANFVSDGTGVYQVDTSGKKHHVPTYDDYIALGIGFSNTTSLSATNVSSISSSCDALGSGKVIAVGNGLYVINNNQTLHIPTADTFNIFGFSWSRIYPYDSSIQSCYPSGGELAKFKYLDGSYGYVLSKWLIKLSPKMSVDFGLKSSGFTPLSAFTVKNLVGGITPSKFLYNMNDGRIYYASGGALHYVSTYSAYVAYGGTTTTATIVNNDFISNFLIGQPI